MAINGTQELIQTITVSAGGIASIDFQNIPQTYDDLKLVFSLRYETSAGYATIAFNNSTSNFSNRTLEGNGSSTMSFSGGINGAQSNYAGAVSGSSDTASFFGNAELYIPNYTSSNNKTFSIDAASENGNTTAYLDLITGLWSQSAAINRITLSLLSNNDINQHSTATLYGITRIPSLVKATGGVITEDSNYWYHTFTSSGVFTPTQNLTCDYLVVGAGGGGGESGGGGGSGGLRVNTSVALTSATNYTVTIGGGGATTAGASANRNATLSSFSTFQASGGGGGGEASNVNANGRGGNGGSGGGGAHNIFTAGTGNSGSFSPVEGYDGGVATNTTNNGGGGGGATAVGQAGSGNVGGNGGAGSSAYSSWATATLTGSGGAYAGGGGGWSRSSTAGVGGAGGGGNGGSGINGTAGLANTGGGGGNGATGGSGIVIVRYAK